MNVLNLRANIFMNVLLIICITNYIIYKINIVNVEIYLIKPKT